MSRKGAMQITCPSCEAVYEVPGEKIAGRQVRCVKCGAQWTPVPPPPALPEVLHDPVPAPEPQWEAELPPPLPSVTPAPLEPMVPPEPRRNNSALVFAWIGSLVLLAAIIVGAYSGREDVMRAWPPSQRLYGALGLR
jgi:predicted Zn finger-like uncharacterized protein